MAPKGMRSSAPRPRRSSPPRRSSSPKPSRSPSRSSFSRPSPKPSRPRSSFSKPAPKPSRPSVTRPSIKPPSSTGAKPGSFTKPPRGIFGKPGSKPSPSISRKIAAKKTAFDKGGSAKQPGSGGVPGDPGYIGTDDGGYIEGPRPIGGYYTDYARPGCGCGGAVTGAIFGFILFCIAFWPAKVAVDNLDANTSLFNVFASFTQGSVLSYTIVAIIMFWISFNLMSGPFLYLVSRIPLVGGGIQAFVWFVNLVIAVIWVLILQFVIRYWVVVVILVAILLAMIIVNARRKARGEMEQHQSEEETAEEETTAEDELAQDVQATDAHPPEGEDGKLDLDGTNGHAASS